MVCPMCGAEALRGEDFCPECGWDLRAIDVPLPVDAVSEMLLEHPIREMATMSPIAVHSAAPVQAAITLMNEHDIRCLLVVDDGVLVGILTERDLVLKLDPERPTESAVYIRDIMTSDPVVVDADAPISTAMQRLVVDRIHHLPVMADGEVIGIVAMRDLMHQLVPALLGDG